MLRLLILIALGVLIYQLFRRSKPVQTYRRDSRGQEIETKELVRDPVCKMYLAEEAALRYEGQFFCSEKCKRQFIESKSQDRRGDS